MLCLESNNELGPTPNPTYELYNFRRKFVTGQHSRGGTVPVGFPLRIDCPSVWSGITVGANDITHHLDPSDVDEIKNALSAFKASQARLNDLSPATFELPWLAPRLRRLSDEIYQGRGLFILKGLNSEDFSTEDNVIIHAGVSSYIAPMRGSQTAFNDQVFHVCNREKGRISDLRGNSTASSLAFHSDDTDILGFYVVEPAMSGGEMMWASHTQVYNELAATRPEVLRILEQDEWPFRTATPMGEPEGCVRLPLLYQDKQGPYFWLARGNLIGGERDWGDSALHPLSLQQADALDAVHFTALKHSIKVSPERGDMYFINNLSVLHSRRAFRDDDFGDSTHGLRWRRHILRLWLRDPARGREILHPTVKHRWEQVFDQEKMKNGRWLLRDMKPEILSHCLFKDSLPVGTISTSQH